MTPRLSPDRSFGSTIRVPNSSKGHVSVVNIWGGLAFITRDWLPGRPIVGSSTITMVLFLLLAVIAAAKALSALSPDLSSPTQLQATTAQAAQAEAEIGQTDLSEDRPHEAQAHCEAALKLDPTDRAAKACLESAARMFIDQDLNEADSKLRSGDRKGAISIASTYAGDGTPKKQQDRAQQSSATPVQKARRTSSEP